MPAKKKAVRYKPVVRTPKTVKRDIRSLKNSLKKEVAIARRVKKKTAAHDRELELLKREIERLSKKRKRSSLSDYNRFMRAQIMRGLSFKQAVRAWNKKKREAAERNKKRTPYNVFISMQLKQGKTMKQAIRAWNLLKNPPKKRRRAKKAPKVIVKRKIIIRRIRAKEAKPKRKFVRRKPRKKPVKRKSVWKKLGRRKARKRRFVRRRIVRRSVVREHVAQPVVVQSVAQPRSVFESKEVTVEKPVIVEKEVLPSGLATLVEEVQREKAAEKRQLSKVVSEQVVSESTASKPFGDQELVLNLLEIYFSEVIRHGLKRRFTLDEIINAYFYTLVRVERKGLELKEIEKIVSKGVIKR